MDEAPKRTAEPRAPQPGEKWTEERKAYLRQAFPAGVQTRDLRVALNAMPGPDVGSTDLVGAYCGTTLKLHRPPGFVPSKARLDGTRAGRKPLTDEQKRAKEDRRRARKAQQRAERPAAAPAQSEPKRHAIKAPGTHGATMQEIINTRHKVIAQRNAALAWPPGRVPTTAETEAYCRAHPDRVTRLPPGYAEY